MAVVSVRVSPESSAGRASPSIVAVGITVRVRVTPNAPIAQIETLVHVRNVDYNPSD